MDLRYIAEAELLVRAYSDKNHFSSEYRLRSCVGSFIGHIEWPVATYLEEKECVICEEDSELLFCCWHV